MLVFKVVLFGIWLRELHKIFNWLIYFWEVFCSFFCSITNAWGLISTYFSLSYAWFSVLFFSFFFCFLYFLSQFRLIPFRFVFYDISNEVFEFLRFSKLLSFMSFIGTGSMRAFNSIQSHPAIASTALLVTFLFQIQFLFLCCFSLLKWIFMHVCGKMFIFLKIFFLLTIFVFFI